MSTASITIAETPVARGDAASVWSALVNATATWIAIQPELFEFLDWEKLIAAAQYHGVLPIVAQRVLESPIASEVDFATKEQLRRALHANLIRALPLADEVLRVMRSFADREIPVIPYKGPVLAEHLWGNSALRECADLDFLVETKNVHRAGEILEGLGYARVSPVAQQLRRALLRNASEEQFQHRETGLLLELQWSPAPRVFALRCDVTAVWSGAREISFSGEPALAPSPADLLMLLSIHGWKHNWARLIWLGDVAQLMRTSHLDWDRLLSNCQSHYNLRLLALAVRLANRVFGVPLPGPFAFADGDLEALVNELELRMCRIDPCGYRDWHRCMLSARDRRIDRVRQMTTFLFTPGLAEYAACELPVWASAGYRAIRLARLFLLSTQKHGE